MSSDPTPRLKLAAALAQWMLGLALAAWLLLGAAWGLLNGWIVPRADEFRPVLEREASQRLGVPVRIGEIVVTARGFAPTFELRDVRLQDAQGRDNLRLPRVRAAITPASLLRLGLAQLVIDAPELDVRLDAQGRLRVAGMALPASDSEPGEAADWLFSQPEIVIAQGTVRWTNEQLGQAPLLLSDVNLVLRNDGRRHDARLDATPPMDWGGRFTAMAQMRHPLLSRQPGQWRQWKGELYVQTARTDLSRLREQVDLGVDVRSGRGELRLWADLDRGQITGAAADVALDGVQAVLRSDLAPLELSSLSGRLAVRRLPDGFEFTTPSLQFQTADGLRWPGGNLRVSHVAAEGSVSQGELDADLVDLAALSQVAGRLPIDAALRELLKQHDPAGRLEKLSLRWRGPLNQLAGYEARGRVVGLSVRAGRAGGTPQLPLAGVPGVRGADLDFDLTDTGGSATLALKAGALVLPGLMAEPEIGVDSLDARVKWRVSGDRWSMQFDEFRFANADMKGQWRGNWATADPATSTARSRFPGVVDLEGTLERAQVSRVPRYLPLVMDPLARSYLQQALVSGAGSNASFRIKGDLWDFPYPEAGQGLFTVRADIKDAEFAFAPTPRKAVFWPRLKALSGRLLIDNAALEVRDAAGRVADTGLVFTKANARIADYMRNSEVEVTAPARGSLSEVLALVQTTPLADLTQQALRQATGSGPLEARLQLKVPVDDPDATRAQVALTLQGNDFRYTPETPALSRLRGTVNVSEAGFSMSGVQAQLLGGEVRLDGSMKPAGALQEAQLSLRAQGVVQAEGLRAARELPFLVRLGQSATGGTSYSATLTVRRERPEFSISSNLQGLAVNLPAPLGKTAEAVSSLRFESSLLAEPAGSKRVRDRLVLELGRNLALDYERDVSTEPARVLRGSIAVGLEPGESVPAPPEGVAANINLRELDVDAWEDVLGRLSGSELRAALATPPSTPSIAPTARPTLNPLLGYLPNVLAIRADELTVSQRKLSQVVVGGSREGLQWRANIQARELNGYLEYRQGTGAAPGRIYARLARLALEAPQASEVERLLDAQPASIPALDLVVEDMELRGIALGRVEVEAINRIVPGAGSRDAPTREWRLSKLNLDNPEASLAATGNWVALGNPVPVMTAPGAPSGAGGRRRTVLNFRLDIQDSGRLLERFGQKGLFRGGKGRMEGQVAWLGSPISLDTPSMTGRFNINIEAGQFLKADPGIARLLGVLSLQSLPRRLSLDFRDVFSEGFAFDFIRGDVQIDQGIASTNNLQMKGVNAAVLMDGSADIARETQDIKVVVVPEINAGTASLVASVINPAVGIGTFLAQLFLRRPLIEANTQEFRIDGSWVDPRVTRVDRKAASPAAPSNPVTAPAPAPAPAQAPAPVPRSP